MGRILTWVVLAASIGIVIVALVEVDRRTGEEIVAQPSALPSPVVTPSPTSAAEAASPGVTGSPAQTQPLPSSTGAGAAATSAPTPTVAPPRTPTPAPIIPTPTPRVGASGVEPMPKTGGGALFGGAIVTMIGLLLSYAARRAY